MYMRAALLALALGQASALLSSPPNDDKHAAALSSPPSDDKHASALTSPPSDDKHASALSSPPSDDKFAVLRGLDNAQLMAEVARRNLNACDGAPPQEHRALTELHYSFKYECSCDPTPEPTAAPTTPAPSPSPTKICEPHFEWIKDHYGKLEHMDYHTCSDKCKDLHGYQLPCMYDEHVDNALTEFMSAGGYHENGVWVAFKRIAYDRYQYGHEVKKSWWKWAGHCEMPGTVYCQGAHCTQPEGVYTHWAHSSHPDPNWRKRNGYFTTSAKYVRKSIASGHGGGMADVEYCSAYACACQKKCH